MGKEFTMISTDTIQDYIETFWDDYDVDEGIEYAEWHIRTVNSIALRAFGKSFPDHDYDKVDRDDEARVLMYGRRYTRNDDSELDPLLQDYYIGQHVKMHEHHPEHWDDSIDIEDFHESRPPHVDCSRMTDNALTELVCDWSAVAVSFGSDLLSWYKRTVGDDKRFGFTKRQRRIILNGFEKVADTCANLGCYLDKNELHRLLADVKMDEKVLEEKVYHEGLPSTIDDVRNFYENPSELREFLKRISDEELYNGGEYSCIIDQWYGESNEHIDNELKKELGWFLHKNIGTLSDKGAEEEYAEGTISLYRFIGYNTKFDVNMGRCWAKGLDGVCFFLDNYGEPLEKMSHFKLVHASTSTDNINWVATLLAVLDGYCEERERRVVDDSKMDIIWVKDFDSYDSAYSYISENM